jgi:hypothetical protein
MLIFMEGGTLEDPEKKALKARERTNKQLNSHVVSEPRIKPMPIGTYQW